MFEGLTPKTAEMLCVDLTAAGIPYETDSGVADFHALRAAYVTNLVASGASVKTCQTLARHSNPSLTIGIYAKASLHDTSGAVEALPDLTAARPSRATEVLRKTGTDGSTTDSATGRMSDDDDDSTQVITGRWESNPHGRSRPEDFKSSASAVGVALATRWSDA